MTFVTKVSNTLYFLIIGTWLAVKGILLPSRGWRSYDGVVESSTGDFSLLGCGGEANPVNYFIFYYAGKEGWGR